ncbi:endothiapepsin precursor [Stachybotrys elegans]|uniref:Endothiapepsin n=1 Tax=Stachybotrys elegans TaxID=80388 RepID=A0A8K0WS08_9HYPO|nr:endothiapepsin precursor [Stachybotrys elegans]
MLPFSFLFAGLVAGTSGSRSSFSVEVQQASGQRDFVREWLAARSKWGDPGAVSDLSHLLTKEGNDTIVLDPLVNDSIYVANVEIGNPPQTTLKRSHLNLPQRWVQSTDTQYRVNIDGPWAPQYKPNASSTAEYVENSSWDVLYGNSPAEFPFCRVPHNLIDAGDGSHAHGIVYQDTVRLGNFTIQDMSVQSAELMARSFEDELGLSGILGLAYTLENNIQPPAARFIDLLEPALARPIFACDLGKNAPGKMDFGFVDNAMAPDGFVWLDTVEGSVFWDVELGLTSWGDNDTWFSHDFTVTVDTGTTLLFLPKAIVDLYWRSVPGMEVVPTTPEVYLFPCHLEDELPDLKFKIPGVERVLTVPGPNFYFGPLRDDPTYCYGGLQTAEGFHTSIMGSTMLKAFYVAFDMENGQVGFASKEMLDK